jgi:hypothetical protein
MTRLRRFLHLERPRSAPVDPEIAPSSRARFGAVDSTADELAAATPPAAERVPAGAPPADGAGTDGGGGGASMDRFREPVARAPDVAKPAPDAQPFVRCFRCETDNTVYAERCSTCGAPLDTPEQRRFNEALWTERQQQARQLEDEVRRLREASARAEEEAYRARRQMGELIAREVGRQERDRLARDEGGGWASGGRWGQDGGGGHQGGWGMGDPVQRDRRPLGIRLLFSIQDPGRRLIAIAVVVSVFVFLVAAAFMSPALGSLLWIAFFLFAVLFAPRNRRWR